MRSAHEAVAHRAVRQTSAPASATLTSYSTVLPLTPLAPMILLELSSSRMPPPKVIIPPLLTSA